MVTQLSGPVFVFGDNVDTDQIYPGRYLELTEPAEIAGHLMEGVREDFARTCPAGAILAAGRNFGCGSSREHAAIALKASGVSLVIAESFARIFYRNCVNLGLPLLVCPGISGAVFEGDVLEVDLGMGSISKPSEAVKLFGQELSPYVLEILEAGGIKPLLRSRLEAEKPVP